jgi:hypothetical protein
MNLARSKSRIQLKQLPDQGTALEAKKFESMMSIRSWDKQTDESNSTGEGERELGAACDQTLCFLDPAGEWFPASQLPCRARSCAGSSTARSRTLAFSTSQNINPGISPTPLNFSLQITRMCRVNQQHPPAHAPVDAGYHHQCWLVFEFLSSYCCWLLIPYQSAIEFLMVLKFQKSKDLPGWLNYHSVGYQSLYSNTEFFSKFLKIIIWF